MWQTIFMLVGLAAAIASLILSIFTSRTANRALRLTIRQMSNTDK